LTPDKRPCVIEVEQAAELFTAGETGFCVVSKAGVSSFLPVTKRIILFRTPAQFKNRKQAMVPK
jgi:hypothetical protein